MRFEEILAEAEIGAVRIGKPGEPHQQLRLRGPLEGYPEVLLTIGALSHGFVVPEAHLMAITDREVFGRYKRRHVYRKIYKGTAIKSIEEVQRGDFVVHVEHGIGRFLGIRQQKLDGEQQDFIEIEYKDTDKLLVPIDKVAKVQKYSSSTGQKDPTLDKLGGQRWQKRKSKSSEQVEIMARELLSLYAERETAKGFAADPDNHKQREFEAGFLYQETTDQLNAIMAVKDDMQKERPMDRLVCGDVGYGKTEVAIRAAFKAIQNGRQVALLCPTTILAQQHYLTFVERFADFPIKVELLSRFRTAKQIKESLQRIKEGDCHMVVGTHRLLSKDVKFVDLGLLVIDEEQRFGVTHKERLKQMRKEVDVLTLTATPIPRTLYMALSGLRDMSLISTAPADRYPVRTRVIHFEKDRIEEAILRELNRGGQVYFVHNRVHNIQDVHDRLKEIVPKARVAVAHGQMNERELEDIMLQFIDGAFDVLLATTIIENGLDIPNCNTIIINRADAFGLAQLYQLRGRVGRSTRRSYAYLIVPDGQPITDTAVKRLEAIQEFTELGHGFNIAMRDLEIRGTGNILGSQQHGTLEAIGFELYCEMLETAVRRLRGEEVEGQSAEVEISWRVPSFIPPEFIPIESQRFGFYKRMAGARREVELDALQEELRDRFGKLPEPVANLIKIGRLRILAGQAGATRMAMTDKGFRYAVADHRELTALAIWNDLVTRHPGVDEVSFDNDNHINITVKAWAKGRRLEKATKLFKAYLANLEPDDEGTVSKSKETVETSV
jgi:transcription-repair coupling factor (superfamily II helicase)